jgi:hypothetical protein
MVEHFVPPFDFEHDEEYELRNALRGMAVVARNRRQQFKNSSTWFAWDAVYAIPCTPCWVVDVLTPAECCMPRWERLQYQHAISHWQFRAKQNWMRTWQRHRERMIVEEHEARISLQRRVYDWQVRHR